MVTDKSDWESQREYLKALLAEEMYGHRPDYVKSGEAAVVGTKLYGKNKVAKTNVQLLESTDRFVREKVTVTYEGGVEFPFNIVRPNDKNKHSVIVFAVYTDDAVCPIEEAALAEGYAIATFNYNVLSPDKEKNNGGQTWTDEWQRGIAPKLYPECDWRCIAMWSFGFTLVIDYLETVSFVEMSKIGVAGHSRLGKAALCAAIYDDRATFCAVAGACAGGAASYRILGNQEGEGKGVVETIGDITQKKRYWYWFTDKFASYGNTEEPRKLGLEDSMPFDGHFLLAAVAPRPVILLEGKDDEWANPHGAKVSWQAADAVFRFLGCSRNNAINFRDGGHQFNAIDWRALLNFANDVWYEKDVENRTYLLHSEERNR